MFTGVNDVFSGPLNTSDGCEDVDNVQESDDEDEGVKVLRGNQGNTENNCEAGNLSDHDRFEDLFSKLLISACEKQDNEKVVIASDNIFQF